MQPIYIDCPEEPDMHDMNGIFDDYLSDEIYDEFGEDPDLESSENTMIDHSGTQEEFLDYHQQSDTFKRYH